MRVAAIGTVAQALREPGGKGGVGALMDTAAAELPHHLRCAILSAIALRQAVFWSGQLSEEDLISCSASCRAWRAAVIAFLRDLARQGYRF